MVTIHHNSFSPHEIAANTSSHMIDIFSHGGEERVIRVQESSTLRYLFIATGECKINLSLVASGTSASLEVWGLCLATSSSDLEVTIKTALENDFCKANVHIVSFISEGGKCKVDGGLTMKKGIHQGEGRLLEENILLGKNIQIKTLPMLDIQSNDVKASHGATIQRLDEEKLFYLTSKGISLPEAKKLMITGYFDKLFEAFGEDQEVANIKENYLQQLLVTL